MNVLRNIVFLLIFIVCVPLKSEEKVVLSVTNDVVTRASEKILAYAYQQIGVSFETMQLPAERALLWSSQAKHVDGEINRVAMIGDMYPNLIQIPVAINTLEVVVFSKKKDIIVNDWESLRPYSILIRIGTKKIEAGTEGMNVRKLPSTEQVFHTLENSRYDIAVNARMAGMLQIERQGLSDINVIEPPLGTYKLYHYLHKKHKSLVPKITQQLIKMKESGRIKAMRDEYLRSVISKLDN